MNLTVYKKPERHLDSMSCLLILSSLGVAGGSKLAAGGVPDWFLSQFQNSPLNLFDGSLAALYYGIVLAESFIGLAALGLLFHKNLRTEYTGLLLVLSALTFIGLGIGQRLSFKFTEAALLFMYASSCLVLCGINLLVQRKTNEGK